MYFRDILIQGNEVLYMYKFSSREVFWDNFLMDENCGITIKNHTPTSNKETLSSPFLFVKSSKTLLYTQNFGCFSHKYHFKSNN